VKKFLTNKKGDIKSMRKEVKVLKKKKNDLFIFFALIHTRIYSP